MNRKPDIIERVKGMDTGKALVELAYHLNLREIYVGRVQKQLEIAKWERDVIRSEIEYLREYEGGKEKNE